MEVKQRPRLLISPRQTFWLRFAIWVSFALILPLAFMVWRFNLFTKINAVSIGGWGIVAFAFVAGFVGVLYKYLKRGLPYSLFTQVLNGVVKILMPLAIAYYVLFLMKNSINETLQLLSVLFACNLVAIPVNPMPRWVYENRKEETETLIDVLLDRREERKKEK